jgi:hypothetical protein
VPELCALSVRLEELEELVREQASAIIKKGEEIDRLKAGKLKTSWTSSKPPSSDRPWSEEAVSSGQ